MVLSRHTRGPVCARRFVPFLPPCPQTSGVCWKGKKLPLKLLLCCTACMSSAQPFSWLTKTKVWPLHLNRGPESMLQCLWSPLYPSAARGDSQAEALWVKSSGPLWAHPVTGGELAPGPAPSASSPGARGETPL